MQPHAETKARQLSAWKALVLDYHRIKKESILDIHEAMRSPLFFNSSINRKLEPDFILLILNDLMHKKNAAPCDKSKNRWEIYWHTLEEWASIIYNYVVNNGLTNSVCTFFELTQSEDVMNEGKYKQTLYFPNDKLLFSFLDFYGLNEEVLLKVLKVLEHQRKCELIMMDDKYGVKFY